MKNLRLIIYIFFLVLLVNPISADANNYCSNAQEFSWSGATGSISPAGDNDWWWINVGTPGLFTVELDGPSGKDFDLYVHKKCGESAICDSESGDADEECEIDPAGVGKYYINIVGYSGTGDYKLIVDLSCKADGGSCPYKATSTAYCCGGICNENGICETYDPCEMITCADKCKDANIRLYNGYCSGGECFYSEYNCNNKNYCGDWVYYCLGNERRKHRKYYDYICSSGSCVYNDWEWRDDQLVEKCEFGCSGGECFACDLNYCLQHSDNCCTRQEVCKSDGKCNTNCEYGDYPDPDCCSNECTDGTYRCNGNTVEKCYDSDSDSCTEWTGYQSCAHCANGQCVDCTENSHCYPDGWYCDSGEVKEYRDYYCSDYDCKYSASGRYDCDNDDGYYCKNSNERGYRDYSCSSGSCSYSSSNLQSCEFGCSGGECFACDLNYCLQHSDNCCTRKDVCGQDWKCNTNCEYGDYTDSDCCSDECISNGTKRCQNNAQETCGDYDFDVCLEWGCKTDCGYGCEGNICSTCDLDYCLSHSDVCCEREVVCQEDGECNTNCEYGDYPDPDCCESECSPNGKKRCGNNIEETCADYNLDGCLEWGNDISCQYGCDANQCLDCNLDYCLQYSNTCCTRQEVCKSDGKCNTNCEYGNYPDPDCCDDGCIDEGSTRCLDSKIKQTCGDYDTDICLEWGNDEGCKEYCLNGQCHNCNIPDGTSSECECDSDVECAKFGDYYCNQVSGPDACEPIKWQDKCSNYNDYFCENGDVYQCKNTGKMYEKVLVDHCGTNKFCDSQSVEGTGKCSVYPNHLDLWIDYAGVGVDVNKQPGDKLKVNIYCERDFTATLNYDSDVFSGDCPNGQINLVKGENSCNLVVDNHADDGKYKITLDKNVAIVNVIYYPSLIVVSDSEKLNERFPNQPRGVMALLKQAYENAEDDGVVYDLSWYYSEIGENNPFNSFSSYDEKISKPKNFDNSYSLAVGEFIRGRCYACTDVMVVGDDYVVPYYRRSIDTIGTKWIFWEEKGIKDIYTDMPYSQKEVLQFSNYYEMFMIEGEYSGKEVLIIEPHDVTPEQSQQIERLKQALEDRGYNPDFVEPHMDGKDVYCVDERWFSDVKGKTLIIIGTEENNNAFECMPFVAGDVNRDAVFIQPNVWDNNEYALVINTNDAGVIEFFAQMVEDEKVVELKGKEAYLFHIGVQYASYAALGVGVGALIVGSGGTAAVAFGSAAWALDTIADSVDVADSCYVNADGIGWCGASIAFLALPYIPGGPVKRVLRNMDDAVFNSNLKHFFENVDDLINKYFRKLRSSRAIGDEAFEKVAKTLEDNKYIAKGSKRFIGDNFAKLDNMPFSQVDNARFIKSIGEVDETLEVSEQYLKGIEIKKRLPTGHSGLYDLDTKGILISEEYWDETLGVWIKADVDEIIELNVKHELGHAKVAELLKIPEGASVFDKVVNFNDDEIHWIARSMDEFTANKLVKSSLADNTIFVSTFRKIDLDISDAALIKIANNGNYGTLLQIKAEAIEFGNDVLATKIDNLIPDNLKDLFDLNEPSSLINRYLYGTTIKNFNSLDDYSTNMNNLVQEIKGVN